MSEDARARAWQQHAREQLLAWQRLSHRQRLDWLWQAKLFAARALRAAEARRAGKGLADTSAGRATRKGR